MFCLHLKPPSKNASYQAKTNEAAKRGAASLAVTSEAGIQRRRRDYEPTERLQKDKAMIALSHPTGNTFVRSLLKGLHDADKLHSFHTTIAITNQSLFLSLLPQNLRSELKRRSYNLPNDKINIYPSRELLRLLASKLRLTKLLTHEHGWASVDSVYRHLDHQVARFIDKSHTLNGSLNGVYCYEDGALETFIKAKKIGLNCLYELPIAYWQTSQKLLRQEAERLPDWACTIHGLSDSEEKLERKTEEILEADVVICPSFFVLNSIPADVRQVKPCVVAPYGSPQIGISPSNVESKELKGPMRVLFAGAMTQRKGLADLFGAMKLLNRNDVELIVLGTPQAPMEFYQRQFSRFKYEQTRSHGEVLKLMRSCHVFALPSVVEGRALVQQEAMMCGLPLIITPNTGGQDLIDEGETGFLVPIRCPEKIAQCIAFCADNRSELELMGDKARQKAESVTWAEFNRTVLKYVP